jgi:hypothetical protein
MKRAEGKGGGQEEEEEKEKEKMKEHVSEPTSVPGAMAPLSSASPIAAASTRAGNGWSPAYSLR